MFKGPSIFFLAATLLISAVSYVHGPTYAATVLGSFSTANTSYANVTDPDTRTFTIPDVVPGTTVRVGTCGLTGASNTGPVIIRILNGAGATMASADWGCGSTASALTAVIVPRVSTSATFETLTVKVGCDDNLSCSGTVVYDTVFDSNGSLNSVPTAYQAIATSPGGNVSGYARTFGAIVSNTGLGHYQGFQRLRAPFLGGSLPGSTALHGVLTSNNQGRLHFLIMGSKPYPFTSYWDDGQNTTQDHIENIVVFSDMCAVSASFPSCAGKAVHLGGIQVSGRYLFVPAEHEGHFSSETDSSAVMVFDVFDTINPVRMYTIGRNSMGAAGGVAVAKLTNGDGLMVVAEGGQRLEFYRKTRDPNTNFVSLGENTARPWARFCQWYENIHGVGSEIGDFTWGSYQSINLVTQADGQVYLVGTHNNGSDWIDLYRLEFCPTCPMGPDINGFPSCGGVGSPIRLVKVGKRVMTCGNPCNLDSAGVYVLPGSTTITERLILYSSPLCDDTCDSNTVIEFKEF